MSKLDEECYKKLTPFHMEEKAAERHAILTGHYPKPFGPGKAPYTWYVDCVRCWHKVIIPGLVKAYANV